MAAARPPPGLAMSPRKRNRSRRFDFPDAFGPTINNRSRIGKSSALKLRQLLAVTLVMRISTPLVVGGIHGHYAAFGSGCHGILAPMAVEVTLKSGEGESFEG